MTGTSKTLVMRPVKEEFCALGVTSAANPKEQK